MREFYAFLKEYGVIGLALAVIIGGKLNALVTAVVDGFLMPIVTPFIPGGEWRTMKYQVGPFLFQPGPIVGAAIDFFIIALFVFLIAKTMLHEETVAKK